MKKILLVLSGTLLIANCFAQTTVKVSNGTELLKAIAPNVTIELAEGNYDLPLPKMDDNTGEYTIKPITSEFVLYDYDGYYVSNVQNLTLVGKGKTRSHIFFKDKYLPVLQFTNCTNLTLTNLRVGHNPPAVLVMGCGATEAPVFRMTSCTDVNITNVGMYGCGNWGIMGSGVSNFNCSSSDIYECNVGIMDFSESKELMFKNYKFYNNTTGSYSTGDFITLRNDTTVTFENCQVTNNKIVSRKDKNFGPTDPKEKVNLVYVYESTGVEFKKGKMLLTPRVLMTNDKKMAKMTGVSMQ